MRRVSFYDPLYDVVTFEEAESEQKRSFFHPFDASGSGATSSSNTSLKGRATS